MIVEFPRSRMRRILSRRPRRSKNGTPEERAAQRAADEPAGPRTIQRRKSKNGTFEEREAKRTAATAAVIAFRQRQPRHKFDPDSPLTKEEFAAAYRRLNWRQRAILDREILRIANRKSPDEPEPAA